MAITRGCAVFLSLLVGFGAPLHAEGGPEPERVMALVAAIRAQDCRLTPDTAATILAAAAISEEDAAIALARLVDEGGAKTLATGGWQLSAALCVAG